MRWRRLLLGLGAVVMLGVAGLLALALWPRSAVTQQNYDRLRYGMTERSAKAILGEPEETEIFDPDILVVTSRGPVESRTSKPPHKMCGWYGENLAITVVFDTGGKVCWACIQNQPDDTRWTLWHPLRHLLPW
jgi:hypothetical protein